MSVWQERIVDLGGRVRVVDYGGRGDTFVCVHGLGGWALDWQVLAPPLTDCGRVLALDLPGFGDSPLAARSAAVSAQQELLDRYLEAETTEPVVLIGNSMGGMISLLQAISRPASVSRMVLLSPVLPASPRRMPHPAIAAQFAAYAMPQLGEWFMRARRELLDPRALVDGSLAFMSAHPERIPSYVYQQRYALVRRLNLETDRAFLAAARSLLSLLASRGEYERIIRYVDVPVLVIHGADDPLVSAKSAHHLARTRPDWAVHVLPEVGHVPMLEAPRQVAHLVRRWLTETDALVADSVEHT
jgi:pimeloyl-ACP methyl ester carboxylesterase